MEEFVRPSVESGFHPLRYTARSRLRHNGIRSDGTGLSGPETRAIGTQTEVHPQLFGIHRPIDRYLSLSTSWVPRSSLRTDPKGRDAWTDQSKHRKSKGVHLRGMGNQLDVRLSKKWNTIETRSNHANPKKKNEKTRKMNSRCFCAS